MCSFLERVTAFFKGVYVPEKLTTVSGGGRGVGRNTRLWLRADYHGKFTAKWRKPGTLVSGGDYPRAAGSSV